MEETDSRRGCCLGVDCPKDSVVLAHPLSRVGAPVTVGPREGTATDHLQDSGCKTMLQRQIEATDRQIDRLAYVLYE